MNSILNQEEGKKDAKEEKERMEIEGDHLQNNKKARNRHWRQKGKML